MKNLKVVILAGGRGTRIADENEIRPKPLIEIGGKPILWHIMKYYSFFGINQFVICLGYKGNQIKDYFSNYFLRTSDITFDFKKNKTIIHNKFTEPWLVTLIDTGNDSMTGGRIKRIKNFVSEDENFFMTYGDGVSNVNIKKLYEFHKKHKKVATVTAVRSPARFGSMKITKNMAVKSFVEKPMKEQGFINGGFFILNKSIFKYLRNDSTIFEDQTLNKLASLGELQAFKHEDFWQPMDTLKDKNFLEYLWANNQAHWKKWK